MRRYLLIALGGALGSMLRYFIGAAGAQRFGPRFPVGTFTINISACFLIGLVIEYLNRHGTLSPAWRYLVAIGFIGSYSTFSTFEWETWADMTRGSFWVGLLYVTSSVILGFIAVAIGSASARVLP